MRTSRTSIGAAVAALAIASCLIAVGLLLPRGAGGPATAAPVAGAAASRNVSSATAAPVIGAVVSPTHMGFPACAVLVNVTKPPYQAKGDGVTDDTDAIQRALRDTMGTHRIVYLPNGTYLVSGTIRYTKQNSAGGEAWGFNWLQGESEANTVIRLKDGVFTDAGKPQPIIWGGGFGSADWFHNYVQNITFDVGKNNPGAIGILFYSNNAGAIRDVQIISQDGAGAVGLDLGSDMDGPLLARNIIVKGFAVGIRAAHTVNSQTFERISVIGQSSFGFTNDGQPISIRGLYSENSVPALKVTSFTCLLDAKLVGVGAAGEVPAIRVDKAGAKFFGRNITTSGYRTAISVEGAEGAPGGHPGPVVAEFMTGEPDNPFGGPVRSLNLPVEETPEVPWDDPSTWAVVEPPLDSDASPAVQAAVDSGATTIFIATPHNTVFRSPVTIRGKVRRVIGCGNHIDYDKLTRPDFIIADGDYPVVTFEHFSNIGGGIQIDANRTFVSRSNMDARLTFNKPCDLFLEDHCGGVRPLPGQRVWARQLNIENQGTHLMNDGATLWILGYKTERGGTLIHTRNGGKTELFGNFSYTTTAGDLAPMFVTEDASAFVYFDERAYGTQPFATMVSETRNGVTRVVKRGEGGIAPYIGVAPDK